MACGGCAARRAARESRKFEYTSPSGQKTVYRTEIEAKAAKTRKGGSYVAVS